MSNYTTQLRFICESEAGLTTSVGFNSVNEVIKNAVPKIFNFEFPIFDEEYRLPLCTKILRHFYTREICEETYGLWKLRLQDKLCEIMPYYNEIYKSQLLKIDPFNDVNYTREYTLNRNNKTNLQQNNKNNSTANTTNKNTDLQMFSETPQSALEHVETGQYLTNATKNTSDGSATAITETKSDTVSSENIDTLDKYIENITGKQNADSYSKRLLEFRETFINTDQLILDELSTLFMLLW